nr:immunoglobulin light chain junction region [Macaca mulatta]
EYYCLLYYSGAQLFF